MFIFLYVLGVRNLVMKDPIKMSAIIIIFLTRKKKKTYSIFFKIFLAQLHTILLLI